ncbi:GNAT family N-acetyltransferase [Vibrio parahaemolyticus]|uniref:GNAT family N-acetyltransferase n=1 Tax=Vibrio parahaemolyticus TaxID=670 RepID=UPI0023630F29|nr:GNAT family N-acetyltransferase [Vibrio parahaemolyticus]EJC6857661.1 GNAT family N-acetyltransferase [Vibrio parahaemolyticus]EKN4581928.1 GNAT family N-acetyltransferase [Vibrio parahaemolyticus]
METKRLKLIPACLERAEEAHQAVVRSQKALEVYLPWVPHVLTLEAMIEGTEKAIANFENFEEELRYYIIEKESDRLLGAVGLMIRDPDVPSFEIGYWLDDAAVGNGYVAEAVLAVERYAFDDLGAKRIAIHADSTNQKSRAVAERCGYEFEGELRNERLTTSGELSNTVIYSKIRE